MMYKLEVDYTTTADGLRLAMGRYPNPDGWPVVLMHGLAQQYKMWDFPLREHSFALYMAAHGYDVWLPCLRGHGYGMVQSQTPPGWDWNIDDHALLDMPAIVARVREVTGKNPVWVGHSLGGLLAYMYLQGVSLSPIQSTSLSVPANLSVTTRQIGITASPELALRRNQELKALVTLAAPPVLKWHKFGFGKDRFWQSNLLVPFLSKWKRLRSVLPRWDRIPLASVIDKIRAEQNANNEEALLQKLSKWPVYHTLCYSTSLFWYPPNVTPAIIYHLLTATLNDVSARVMEQFADWAMYRTCCTSLETSNAPHVYHENLDRIQLPLLVVTGECDKLASHPVIYREGFLGMGSKDKTYQCFPRFGHNDLCVGVAVAQTVFPFLEKWIRARVTGSIGN